ncbi:hypothetical protein BY996DRAFT_7297693 [Phakopsora pachyrhizi]|uniref:Expressed protein n=1 Tax=Phakopsora pachyrhizi TaxID=170000 RepID=A0AAV0BCZ7_PHAPC|nr:hypothetical protein BY996DRAFT_7297693 [Phakopsora pachyrhizi]CAH7684734.1 expressed protein [Phakopsora pachyrhizi]
MFNATEKGLKIIKFALDIPPNGNPHLQVRNRLIQLFTPSKKPSWERYTSKIILFSLVVANIQSAYILYSMISTRRLALTAKTSIGMWKFETLTVHGITSFAFSTLSIVDWLIIAFWNSKEKLMPPGGRRLISGIKFLVAMAGTWCFVWATICHCVSMYWLNKKTCSSTVSKPNNFRLPRYVRWLSHISFLVPMFTFGGAIIWSFIGYHSCQMAIKNILFQVEEKLVEAAQNFDTSNYDSTMLKSLLLPLKSIPQLEEKTLYHLNSALITFTASDIFFLILYPPLSFISLRDLKKKSQTVTLSALNSSSKDVTYLKRMLERLEDTRKTLFYISLSIFLGVLSCLPGLIWELSQSRAVLEREQGYWAVAEILSKGVVSFVMNVNLLIIGLHCKRLLGDGDKDKVANNENISNEYKEENSHFEVVVVSKPNFPGIINKSKDHSQSKKSGIISDYRGNSSLISMEQLG